MENPVFVGRKRELEQLDTFLKRALEGQGTACFVVGEAGSGKTTLVSEFARRAQEAHPELVAAVGQSDAQIGTGDPYLPFREILGQLTGDVEEKLAQGAISQENVGRLRKLLATSGQALVEVGPDLVSIFLPGAGLLTRLGTFLAQKAGWLDKLEPLTQQAKGRTAVEQNVEQSHILEQYTNVLKTLAAKHPLLLVLDDLQWGDSASTELLFRLGRRIGTSHILILGTYRPAEIALGRAGERHPLDKVLSEFKRYFGDIWVDLGQTSAAEGHDFVEAFLDTEHNQLGETFRRELYRRTGGHPLFTIELLRHMQERGDLLQDEQGRWIEGPGLDWTVLPARVEGVIEERLGRLDGELQQALSIASIEGEDFTAEIVAQVQGIEPRVLVRRLSGELDRQHRLVSAQGRQRLGSQSLSTYRFRHHLLQQYLYNDLDEAERAYLHQDVGTALEGFYGEHAQEMPQLVVQLAFHFSEAGIAEKAAGYLHQAGQEAVARFANAEALDYFSRALALIPPKDHLRRFDLLLARESACELLGKREQQRQDLETLEQLVLSLRDQEDPTVTAIKQAQVKLRQANYADITGNYPQAIADSMAVVSSTQSILETVETASLPLGPALSTQASRLHISGYLYWGRSLWRQGNYEKSQTQLDRALSWARQSQWRQMEAASLRNLGCSFFFQGNYAQARTFFEQALHLYRETADWQGEGIVLNSLGYIAQNQSQLAQARSFLEQALRIHRKTGDRPNEADALGNLGINWAMRGDYIQAKTLFEQSQCIYRELGDQRHLANSLANQGYLARKQGYYSQSRDDYELSLEICRAIGNRQGEAMALGNLGGMWIQVGRYAQAQDCLKLALDISREIGDRASMSDGLAYLGLLFHQQGDNQAARDCCQQALQTARAIPDPYIEGVALTFLGHALTGLGELAEAENFYQQALELHRGLGNQATVMETLAGLAGLCLQQGQVSQAQAWVEEVLALLHAGTLAGADEPLRVYLTCYHVLRANQDPRVRDVLQSAYQLLQEQAARIEDEDLRRSFLEEIHVHRQIAQDWAHEQQPA